MITRGTMAAQPSPARTMGKPTKPADADQPTEGSATGDPPIDWANVASEVKVMLDLNHQGKKTAA